MWVYISAKKSLNNCSTIQNRGGNISKILSCTHFHNYCRKHQKFAKCVILHNRTKIVRKSHLLLCKTGIFSSATAIVLQTSANCSYAKASKQQLTAHTSIVKGDMAKCYKHASFSSNALLCSLVLKSNWHYHAKYKTNKFYNKHIP